MDYRLFAATAIFYLTLLGLSPAAHCTGDLTTQIEKTFDYGTLIEHTISAQRGPHRVSLRLRQRREAEGSMTIASAQLTFYQEAKAGAPLLTVPIFEALLADMMNALYGRFGNNLKLEYLGAAGYMGIKEVEKKGILAFHGYAPWERYLNNSKAYSQRQLYTLVHERWAASDVFSAITTAFAPLGVDATFSGFEKLFVFPAEKCFFYPELEDLGIRKTDRFPYPGTISFTLTPKP